MYPPLNPLTFVHRLEPGRISDAHFGDAAVARAFRGLAAACFKRELGGAKAVLAAGRVGAVALAVTVHPASAAQPLIAGHARALR